MGHGARFLGPSALASDKGDILYILDASALRTMSLASGAVKTLTLFKNATTTGPDGKPTDLFYLPTGLTLDGQNLYVSDRASVVKVSMTNGDAALLSGATFYAELLQPGGPTPIDFQAVTTDDTGALYATDLGTSTIVGIDRGTGVVSPIAGFAPVYGTTDAVASDARFDSPLDLVGDDADRIYVADYGNQTIRQVERIPAR